MSERVPRGEARTRLLNAAVSVIRRQGLSATSVDDLCRAAGVTKGAFFHHFASKQDLAVAAVEHWDETTGALFEAAEYHERASAAERVLGYVDLRSSLIEGDIAEFTCLAGTMVQEAYATDTRVREACAANILGHGATLERDLAEALADAGRDDVDPVGLARHMMAAVQGAFVLAKAGGDPALARDSLAHLRRYLVLLLALPPAA